MTSRTVSPSGSQIDDIEALRAIAIAFTLLTHLPNLFPWGNRFLAAESSYFGFFTGVDLFLAVSGFVIARGLLKKFDSSTTREMWFRTLFAFWIRRAYRIWPTSWLWLSVIVIGSAVTTPSIFGPMHVLVSDSAAVLMQVANIHWWKCVSASASGYECGSTTVWWSLSLEEQFYIALPFAALFFRKRLPLFLIVVVLAQLFLDRPNWGMSIFYYIKTDAISLGVLIAILSSSEIYRIMEPTFLDRRSVGAPVVCLLILLLAITAGHGDKIDPVPFSTGLIAMISAILVFVASYNKDYIVRSKLLKPAFLWLGSRSFAIYLIHVPAMILTHHLWNLIMPEGTVFGGKYTLRFSITWLVMTVLLSEANFRFVETPLRRKGWEVAKRMEENGIVHSRHMPSGSSKTTPIPDGQHV